MAQVEDIKGRLDFNDPDEMFEFAIHSINLSNVNSDYIWAFQHKINAIASDFQNNRVPFDKTRACLICGQTGHDFTECPSLQDSEKIKQTYVHLCIAISKFMNLIKKINGSTQQLSRLDLMGINELECTSVLNSTTIVPIFPSTSKSSQDDITNQKLAALFGKKLGKTNKTVNKMLHCMYTHFPKDNDDESIDSLDSLNALSSLLSSSGKILDFWLGWDKY